MEKITPERLAELKASNIPHATIADITIDAPPTVEGITEHFERHLSHYAAPKKDEAGENRSGQPCIACDATHSFTWGMVHGAGHCTNCGWPASLYHFITDQEGKQVAHLRGVLLWAHPDDIEFVEPEGKN